MTTGDTPECEDASQLNRLRDAGQVREASEAVNSLPDPIAAPRGTSLSRLIIDERHIG